MLANYRPISNLSFISQVIEKLVTQLLDHLWRSSPFQTFQSGFRAHHNRETALVKERDNGADQTGREVE